MKWIVIALLLGLGSGFMQQKILRPNSTCSLYELVPTRTMGVTLDINVIDGESIFIKSGMKGSYMEEIELVKSHKKIFEPKEPGEIVVQLINKSSEFANVVVSIYADKMQDDTDEADVLKKMLEKVRIDLMNIYNDILKLKNMNAQSLIRTKSTKAILYATAIFPVLYIVLSAIRLNIIKGFFGTKSAKI